MPLLAARAPVVPARLQNQAGIVGAAARARELLTPAAAAAGHAPGGYARVGAETYPGKTCTVTRPIAGERRGRRPPPGRG